MTASGLRVLVADDEPALRSILEKTLRAEGYRVFTADGGRAACEIAEREQPQIMLVDLTMPDRSGLEVLGFAREHLPGTRVFIMTAFATAETAVEAMKQGALDYLIKPFSLTELTLQVGRAATELLLATENVALRREAASRAPERTIIGHHPLLLAAVDAARRLAGEPTTVLIQGETGTGKELIARALHGEGRPGPLLAINCAAIPEALLERELFGHERGAFTGADQAQPGLLEAASDGTLFLDEIGELPGALQAKFLRVLEGQEFLRVGGTRPLKSRARFIAATNQDLAARVTEGRFRRDLFYRLNVVTIVLPPLRDRGTDLLELTEHFLGLLASGRGRTVPALSAAAREALCAYRWPGNVRELRNVLERALLLAPGAQLEMADLRLDTRPVAPPGGAVGWSDLPLQEAREAFERDYLERALKSCGGNITRTASRIGLDRRNLHLRIKKYGLKGTD